jgi:hypothetical protein
MRYIVVNGRTPAPNAFCALCTEKIGETYCREIDTRLLYCCESHYTGSRQRRCARPRIFHPGVVSLSVGHYGFFGN